jgi:cellulose 1,4-beta-cellobiosidase
MNRRSFFQCVSRVLPLVALTAAIAIGFSAPARAQGPPAPTLTGTPGCNSAILSWTSSQGATGYHVWRQLTPGGASTLIATVTGTSYTDTGLTNGTTYYYRVTAFNSLGDGPASNQVAVTPCCVPPAPFDLSATPGCGKVSLSWQSVSNSSGYHVKRATKTGGPYTTIATVIGSTYTDTSVVNGTTYYYVVTAYNSCGESANSNEASATPHCP